jgi:HPt (histidine-containing phosphotransfer) domain-containing protein
MSRKLRIDQSGHRDFSDTFCNRSVSTCESPRHTCQNFSAQSTTRSLQLFSTGDTTTSQFSTHALSMRFLTRTREEVDQLRACLPEDKKTLELTLLAHIERVAHKISSGAQGFGFKEIDAIAAAIELLAHDHQARTPGQKLLLVKRLDEQVCALEVYVEFALAEKSLQESAADLPMSAYVPQYATRRK